MSDGPHRTPPLSRPWKNVTISAYNPACSLTEVEEKIRYAVRRDFEDLPIRAIQKILVDGTKDRLFLDEPGTIAKLKDLQNGQSTSAAKEALIDCAVARVYEGLSGEQSTLDAINNAIEIWINRQVRSIEEHSRRKCSYYETLELQTRLKATLRGLDLHRLASEIASTENASTIIARPRPVKGVDAPGPMILGVTS